MSFVHSVYEISEDCRGKLQDYVIVFVRLFYNLCIALEWLFYSTEYNMWNIVCVVHLRMGLIEIALTEEIYDVFGQ